MSSPLTQGIDVSVLFTWDVSLQIWKEKGLLQRETLYYNRLAEKGVTVHFLTWGNAQDTEIGKSLHPNIKVFPIYSHIPCPKNKALRALLSPLAVWAARKILKQTNLIKTNQMWGSWVAVLAKLFFMKPLLVRTGFELYRFTCLQNKPSLQRVFIKVISSLAYRAADLIYLATEEDKNFVVKEFSVSETKINIRPNWIDTDIFSPAPMESSATEQVSRILFVGRLNEQKNLPFLIDTIAGTKWGLDIVGQGELSQSLKDYAATKNADVRFIGSVANDALPSIYRQYPVFALLSHYEGNPKSLLEAMACGVSALGTNVEGINSLILSGKNGLLCEKNIDSARDCLDKLMSCPELRKSLGREARNTIINTQCIEHLMQMELSDYRTLSKKGKNTV